nr:protein hunchback-like [Onthophagus taurus]
MVTPPRTPQFQLKPDSFDQRHQETPRNNEIHHQNIQNHNHPVIKSEPMDDYESIPHRHQYNPHFPVYNFQQIPTSFGENPLGNLQTRFGQLSPTNLSTSPQISTPRPELPVTPESPLRTTPNLPSGCESPTRLSDIDLVGTPKKNSSKPKSFKCRMCEYVATTKEESWIHLKTHLKPEKMLCCPRCPFVTEYKHHLEYHLLNHDGSKPFVCPECEYMCVNKSMLRSHLKSHSQIYQYRCKDCDYVSKYCHTFKIHLRKYRHEPGPVLNPDGTEDITKIIDVYGSRRGPRKRTVSIDNLQNPIISNQNQITNQIQNLSIPKLPQIIPEENVATQPPLANPLFNPFLVNSMVLAQFMNLQRFVAELRNRNVESNSESENNDDYTCNVCGVSFKTETLYGIHMEYHDNENPLKCTSCGKTNENGENFFIHLTRERH